MLSNAYFLAKFRFDTAENELAKNLQNFAKNCKICQYTPHPESLGPLCRRPRHAEERLAPPVRDLQGRNLVQQDDQQEGSSGEVRNPAEVEPEIALAYVSSNSELGRIFF